MTTDFRQLTYRGQVARLRALGKLALPRFGISARAPLVLMNHGENTVFQTRDGRGRLYALRIHRTDYQTTKMIRSEMAWLQALSRDTHLRVPVPVAGKDSSFVQHQGHEGVEGSRDCVLLRWVPGRFSHGQRGRAFYERLGGVAGRLHAHGRTWKRPADWTRRPWSREVLQGEAPAFGNALETKGVGKRDRALFKETLERASEVLTALGKGRRVWGLIHADMHAGNVVTQDGVMGAIDFDDCGTGWYGYELAVAIGPPFDMESFQRRLEWFLEPYTEHMVIDQRTIDALECFVVTRRLSMVGWIGSRSDNPRLAKLVPMYVRLARESARAWKP